MMCSVDSSMDNILIGTVSLPLAMVTAMLESITHKKWNSPVFSGGAVMCIITPDCWFGFVWVTADCKLDVAIIAYIICVN